MRLAHRSLLALHCPCSEWMVCLVMLSGDSVSQAVKPPFFTVNSFSLSRKRVEEITRPLPISPSPSVHSFPFSQGLQATRDTLSHKAPIKPKPSRKD